MVEINLVTYKRLKMICVKKTHVKSIVRDNSYDRLFISYRAWYTEPGNLIVSPTDETDKYKNE